MAGALASGVFVVQERQLSRRRVDGKSVDRTVGCAGKSAGLADGIEKMVVRMDGEEGGIGGLRRDCGRGECASGGVQAAHVDAFALLARARPDIDEAFAVVRR